MMAVYFSRSMQLFLKLLDIYAVSDGIDVGFIPMLLLRNIIISAIFYIYSPAVIIMVKVNK
jgi:hypothetical protein